MAAPKRKTAKKTTRARTTRKIVVRKKAKATPKAAPKKTAIIKSAYSKTQILTTIAESTQLTKKQIGNIFDEIANLIECHIKNRGAGEFTLPGLLKIKVVRKPATRARKGINPFTGEETIFKAKPARNVVKVKPLKKLKDMVV